MRRKPRSNRRLSFEPLESRVVLAPIGAIQMVGDHAFSHQEHLSTLVAATELTTVRPGAWSDPLTWAGGVPTAETDVVIRHHIKLDAGTARQITIEAGAVVTLAGELQAFGSIIVRGTLAGDHGLIGFHVANDRLFTGNTMPGPMPEMPDFHPEDTGLWVIDGGVVDFHASKVTSWVRALAIGNPAPSRHGTYEAPAIANGRARLSSAPAGWRLGDTLLLVNERGESQLARLTSVRGSEISFTDPSETSSADPGLTGGFVGKVLISPDGTMIHPNVANLSRRLVIESSEVREGDTNHRAHIAIMAGATANLENVEIRNLGPRGKLGRYPVHWHHGGDVEGVLRGSSIWQDVSEGGNRFVSVHNVHGLVIEDNVAFRSRGHGFFFETKNSYGNRLYRNLSVEVEDGEELTFEDRDVSAKSHHYWVRAGNTIADNIAAGGTAYGLILLDSNDPGGLIQVIRQEVRGARAYGIWAGRPDVQFINPRVVFAKVAGFGNDPAYGVDASGAPLLNPILLLNGRPAGGPYQAQVFLNNAAEPEILGGVLAGTTGIHAHYSSTFTVLGAKIVVRSLLTPTYFELAGKFVGGSITAARLFDEPYPIRQLEPGIVEFENVRLAITGQAVQHHHSAAYMGRQYARIYGLTGTFVSGGVAVRLDTPAQDTGFLVLNVPGAVTFSIRRSDGTGTTGAGPNRTWIPESRWRERLNTHRGYGMGIPPGAYIVELFDRANGSLGRFQITVVSGEVTQTLDPI